MPMPAVDPSRATRAAVRRRPEQLLLAFLGELVVDRGLGPLPTAELIALLAEHGVGEAATRAALSRMTSRGLLRTTRNGRSVAYRLTPVSERVLREARGRVFAQDPFAPLGAGWTLVTFTVPETRRDLRHQVRAQLAWAGFGLLRDGLWIAPGEVDVAGTLGEVRHGGGPDAGGLELVAFRAYEVPGFSAEHTVRSAWRLDEVRARHEDFVRRWGDLAPTDDGPAALRDLTALVADWLDLLRAVPRLPAEHLGPDWPASRSVATFRRLHAALDGAARDELRRRLAA